MTVSVSDDCLIFSLALKCAQKQSVNLSRVLRATFNIVLLSNKLDVVRKGWLAIAKLKPLHCVAEAVLTHDVMYPEDFF